MAWFVVNQLRIGKMHSTHMHIAHTMCAACKWLVTGIKFSISTEIFQFEIGLISLANPSSNYRHHWEKGTLALGRLSASSSSSIVISDHIQFRHCLITIFAQLRTVHEKNGLSWERNEKKRVKIASEVRRNCLTWNFVVLKCEEEEKSQTTSMQWDFIANSCDLMRSNDDGYKQNPPIYRWFLYLCQW